MENNFEIVRDVIFILVFLSIGFLVLFIKFDEWYERKRKRKLGYRVEYVSEAVLREDPNTFAIVYHQGGQMVWFRGKIIGGESILDLDVSEGKGYNKQDPQGIDKDLMKQRVLSEIKRYKIKIKS